MKTKTKEAAYKYGLEEIDIAEIRVIEQAAKEPPMIHFDSMERGHHEN
jgi:hypothetical protein